MKSFPWAKTFSNSSWIFHDSHQRKGYRIQRTKVLSGERISPFLTGLRYAHKDFNNFDTEFSLRDCNVIRNDYNDHRLFARQADAVAYLAECKSKPDPDFWRRPY